MRSGKYVTTDRLISIGSSPNSIAALTRITTLGVPGHVNLLGDASLDSDILISEKRFDSTSVDPNGSGYGYRNDDYRIGVRIGSTTATYDGYVHTGGLNSLYPLGQGWHGNLNFSGLYTATDVTYTFTDRQGVVYKFRPMSSGDCPGLSRCAFVDNVLFPDGTRDTYNYTALPQGQNPTVLKYRSNNRGIATVFDYVYFAGANLVARACMLNMTQTQVTAATTCQGASNAIGITYTMFAGLAREQTITFADGGIRTYSYSSDSAGRTVISITKPGQVQPWLKMAVYQHANVDLESEELVASQQFSTGESYQYFQATAIGIFPPPVAGGSYTDALGNKVVLSYSFPSSPYPPPGTPPGGFDPGTGLPNKVRQMTPGASSIQDALQNTTRYNYCDRVVTAAKSPPDNCLVTVLQDVTQPSGLNTQLFYDGNGEVAEYRQIDPSGLLPNRSEFRTYGCSALVCSVKPTSVKDPNGKVTSYQYSPIHGMVLVETMPADAVGVQRVRQYYYGQFYAWLSVGPSVYVQAAEPVWLPTQEQECLKSATVGGACTGGVSDTIITNYSYSAGSATNGTNLFLNGTSVSSGGVTLFTCYAYDALGNKISETSPRAGLTSCP